MNLHRKVRNAFFWGCPFGIKGWKVIDLETQEIFISRDVVYYENIFPFKKLENTENSDANQLRNMGLSAFG